MRKKQEQEAYDIVKRLSAVTNNPSYVLQQLAYNPYPTTQSIQDWIKNNTIELGVKLVEALPTDQSNPKFIEYQIKKAAHLLGEQFIKQGGIWITSGVNPTTGYYEANLKGILVRSGPSSLNET